VHLRTPLNALALVLIAAVAPRLAAQDVTATPLVWVDPTDAFGELPVPKHPLQPDFPYDLRNTPDFGYVVFEFYTDEEGEVIGRRIYATLPAYEIAVSKEAHEWRLRPGRRDGRPHETYTSCTVIFNPAAAGMTKPDATARLLAAQLVVDPALEPRRGDGPSAPAVVWATVRLDAAGRPLAVLDVPGALKELIGKALQKWRFAPARRAGQAVASEVRVPFIMVPPRRDHPSDSVPPKVVEQVKPDYPYELRRSKLRGEVLLDFEVSVEGRVAKAFVVRSLNPLFDQPALDAIYKWRFEPARRDGIPVRARMQITLQFQHSGEWDGGRTGLTVTNHGDRTKLPPEFRYDVAPKPRGFVLPTYPYALLRDEVTGKARVRFAVSISGHVIFADVISADRPEFGAALQAAVECYEFEPALKDGRPSEALLTTEQNFSRFDQDRVITRDDRILLALERNHPDKIVSPTHLDAKLKPISMRPPVFPVSLRPATAKGEALVEVLVDEEGLVRLPRVIAASDPAFGWAAVQAVAVWRFEKPKAGGKSVVTRVRIPFEFQAKADEAAGQKK